MISQIGIQRAIKINSGAQRTSNSDIQDTKHAQEFRALVHKRVTHPVATINLIL